MMKMSNDDYDYDLELEQEAALAGLAGRVARGHSPSEMARGIIYLLFETTDPDNRWRRLALARLFAEIAERIGNSDHPDAEGCRNLAAKLRAVEAANS